jgi:hypothetical protein
MRQMLHSFFAIVVALSFVATLNATTYTAISGNWSTMVWSPAGTPGPSDDVIIPDGATVTIDQNFTINNLTIGGGASGILRFFQTAAQAITVNGNILVNTGAQFIARTHTAGSPVADVLHTLDLKGNLTHNGSSLDFRAGGVGTTMSVCNLTLSGNTNSTLTVSNTYSSTNGDFNAVTINKTGGAKVILGSNIYLAGGANGTISNSILTFTNGIVETGSYILVSQSTTETNVVGYSSASYVVGAMGRGMSSSGAGNKYFPVGDANGYRLFKLNSTTTGSATGHFAIVRCIPGNANTGSSILVGIDAVSKVRYYQVGYNFVLAGASSMSFERFSPSYGLGDGVVPGSTWLKVAYSLDDKATWTKISANHTVGALDPPVMITPDRINPAQSITAGGSMLIALADSSGGDNPLPVELSSFSSYVNGRNVTLNWVTKTEKNSDKFIIERTTAGNSLNWIALNSVKASVLSNSPKKYSFNDMNLQTGKYLYRLKMIDNDGSFDYSIIVENEISVPINFDLTQNYPNPFNPNTKINYQLPVDANVIMEVYNITGQKVLELVNQDQAAGYYSVDFGASKLTSGVYIYRLLASDKETGNNFSSTKKMMLLK